MQIADIQHLTSCINPPNTLTSCLWLPETWQANDLISPITPNTEPESNPIIPRGSAQNI